MKTLTVDFAALGSRRVDGENAIYTNSLLFRAGDYPDKACSFSPADLGKAVKQFTPVNGNLQHSDFLKGRAGEIRRMWQESDTLRGEVAVPLWLDENLIDAERRLSVEWNLENLTIDGFALCTNPAHHGRRADDRVHHV